MTFHYYKFAGFLAGSGLDALVKLKSETVSSGGLLQRVLLYIARFGPNMLYENLRAGLMCGGPLLSDIRTGRRGQSPKTGGASI